MERKDLTQIKLLSKDKWTEWEFENPWWREKDV